MSTTAPFWSPEELGRDELLALMAHAGRLGQAAADGVAPPQLLRGKRLALLSDSHDSPAATAFRQAATELGAHVARVRNGAPQEAGRRDRAALLGQLYDAIECQGLPASELAQLRRDAGVPVFDGIGSPTHPLHASAALLAPVQDAALQARQRHHLLQALLCRVLA